MSAAESTIWHFRLFFRNILRGKKTYLAAVGILSLGIGMSLAMFSLVDAVLIRPLPFPRQQDIYLIWKVDPLAGEYVEEMGYPELHDLQASLDDIEYAAVLPTSLYGYAKVLQMSGNRARVARRCPSVKNTKSSYQRGTSWRLSNPRPRSEDVPRGSVLVFWLAGRSRLPKERSLFTDNPLTLRGVLFAGVIISLQSRMSTQMSLSRGSRIGQYEILSAVGAGGMGDDVAAMRERSEDLAKLRDAPFPPEPSSRE